MGDALVGADRHVPHLALAGVVGRLGQGVARHAGGDGGAHDPLGVEAHEDLAEPVALGADEVRGRHPHVVEEQGELLLGRQDLDVDDVGPEAGASVGTTNSESCPCRWPRRCRCG